MLRPAADEHAPYYAKYINLVPETDVLAALAGEIEKTVAFLQTIPEAQAHVRHGQYAWTIAQVVGHLVDCERVFGYRALRFARGDETPLPGFDENSYAQVAESDRLTLQEHAAEYQAVRQSHLHFFKHLPDSAWSRRGVANNSPMSVRAVAYTLVGHERHHLTIVRARLTSGQ